MTDTLLLQSKIEHRDRLYFDLYQYSFSFYCKECYALRENGPSAIASRIRFRQQWNGWPEDEALELISNLQDLQRFLDATPGIKYTVSYNYINIYSRGKTVSDSIIRQFKFVRSPRLKQAVVSKPKNTVVLKNQHKYKLRTYLKAQWANDTVKKQLLDFFNVHSEHVKPCGAFDRFLKEQRRMPGSLKQHWIPDHYYIEYNEPLYLTLFGLMLPQSIKKTMPIVQA